MRTICIPTFLLCVSYQAALRGYSKDNFARIEDMKDKSEELRSAREQRRKQVRKLRLPERTMDISSFVYRHVGVISVNWAKQVYHCFHFQTNTAQAKGSSYSYFVDCGRKIIRALESE